jgi:hypothetical protein
LYACVTFTKMLGAMLTLIHTALGISTTECSVFSCSHRLDHCFNHSHYEFQNVAKLQHNCGFHFALIRCCISG